ncbi:MAG TPA: RsmE family RNA methyltransferase [Fimbriimonadaceae bacterium]|nr:RsmE family RNA methyltransferase [Fimbriimonadaceae bacterium]HRJ33340.1 RsmE family RNA methyltransferase [Fimbriimonadaceae bacterium]
MGRSRALPLRALPRLFWPGFDPEEGAQEIPREEFEKLHNVLRLRSGAEIAVLPNDGRIVRCVLDGRSAVPQDVERLETQPSRVVTLAQALPKPDKLDEVLRMCTELGVAHFLLFPSERTVVRWDAKKRAEKERRLLAIIREAAEVSFRSILPTLTWAGSLIEVLEAQPDAIVLSEVEGTTQTLPHCLGSSPKATLVIGPEGGWAPREVALIGDRGATMGPRVFRVDTAAAAACAMALLCD